MSWYKKAEQKDFPFYSGIPTNDIPKEINLPEEKENSETQSFEEFELLDVPKSTKTPISETQEFKQLEAKTPELLQDIADRCVDMDEFIRNIRQFGYKMKTSGKDVFVWVNGKEYKVRAI